MRYPLRSGSAAGLLFGVTMAVMLGLAAPAARADDAIKTASPASVAASKVLHSKKTATAAKNTATKSTGHKTARRRSVPHQYFVEFRARNAASYGHMYVLYGRVNSRDEIVESHIAGFFPAGDKRDCVNCSVFNWTIGHLIFVPSELGASDGDLEEKYVLARFRVWVTRDEYKKVAGYIKKREANPPLWNALWKNCVDFGRDVAEFMNLKVPFFIWLEPKDFVTALREDNGVHHTQLPLKDAATGLRARVRSASRTPPLPPQKPKAKKPASEPSAAAKPAHVKPKKQAAASQPKIEALASTAAH
jgi:hypothetical protein